MLTRALLRRGSFTSRADLIAKITGFAIRYNRTARAWKWAYTPALTTPATAPATQSRRQPGQLPPRPSRRPPDSHDHARPNPSNLCGAALVNRLDNIRDPAALPGWLATTTRRECDRILHTAPKTQPLGYTPDVGNIPAAQTGMAEDELLMAERHAVLREAFTHLP